MPNTNTIIELYGGTSPNFYGQIAPLGNASSETAFSIAPNAIVSGLGGTSVAAIVSLLSASNFGGPASSPVGSIWDNGRPFKIRAAGRVTGGTTTNFTLKLYQVPSAIVKAGTAATLANDNAVQATSARAVNSGSYQFHFELVLQWDSTSQKLGGYYQDLINATTEGPTGIATVAVTADTELNFVLSGLFSASNAGNQAILEEFVIEQV